jgi:hypothetical protein
LDLVKIVQKGSQASIGDRGIQRNNDVEIVDEDEEYVIRDDGDDEEEEDEDE